MIVIELAAAAHIPGTEANGANLHVVRVNDDLIGRHEVGQEVTCRVPVRQVHGVVADDASRSVDHCHQVHAAHWMNTHTHSVTS